MGLKSFEVQNSIYTLQKTNKQKNECIVYLFKHLKNRQVIILSGYTDLITNQTVEYYTNDTLHMQICKT